MTHIIAPIGPKSVSEFQQLAAQAQQQGADAIEWRIDHSAANDAPLHELLASIPQLPVPVLATNRWSEEGGRWQGNEARRLELLLEADAAGAAWIDVELACLESLPSRPQHAKLVVSYHDFHGMGSDVPGKIAAMQAAGADCCKVALTPSDAADLGFIAQLYEANPSDSVCAIAMGEAGLPSRLLAGCWGAAFTFGRLAGDDGSAPGQPTVSELNTTYRIHEQNSETCIFGVIGNPIGHSLSPVIHNAAFQHDQHNAVYVPFLVNDAVALWRACGSWIDGLSITIPHKTALLDEVDGIEDLAQDIGAINTLYRDENERLIGANTDADAALNCVSDAAGGVRGKTALLLGAGGVSRAIAFALQQAGSDVIIANRTVSRAEELAAEVGARAIAFDDTATIAYDILVNGTSVGMREDKSPLPEALHRAETVVFDTVYTPLETTLLKHADRAGATCVCGVRMFIGQALGQYERWTQAAAPEAIMQRVTLEALGG